MKSDVSKEDLYESVKLLIEHPASHLHLPQQKLFTLFTIAFQYLLYQSTKSAGDYLIRIEDSSLLERLIRKSKDDTTRKFMQKMALPRRLRYGNSTFFLDFFHLGSWSTTAQRPKENFRAALVVKNTVNRPMTEIPEDEENPYISFDLPADYYLSGLMEFIPRTVTIAFDTEFEGVEKVYFPFIKNEEKTVEGVRLARNLSINDEN